MNPLENFAVNAARMVALSAAATARTGLQSKQNPSQENLSKQIQLKIEKSDFEGALKLIEKTPEKDRFYFQHQVHLEQTNQTINKLFSLTNKGSLSKIEYLKIKNELNAHLFDALHSIHKDLKANKYITDDQFVLLEKKLSDLEKYPEKFDSGKDDYFPDLYSVLAKNKYTNVMSGLNFVVSEFYGTNLSLEKDGEKLKSNKTKESSANYIKCENLYRESLKAKGSRDNGFPQTLEGDKGPLTPNHYSERKNLFESVFPDGKMPTTLNEFKQNLKIALETKKINQTQVLKILDYFIKTQTSYRTDRSVSEGTSDEYLLEPGKFYKTKTGDCDDYAFFIRDVLKDLKIPVAFVMVPGHVLTVCKADNKWHILEERQGLNEGSYSDVKSVLAAAKKLGTGNSQNQNALQVYTKDLDDLGLKPDQHSRTNTHEYDSESWLKEISLTVISN